MKLINWKAFTTVFVFILINSCGSKEVKYEAILEDYCSSIKGHDFPKLSSQIDVLKQRMRHGCKKDLLQLVNIRSIGRRRARELASMGYRTVKSLAAMSKKVDDMEKSKLSN